VSIINSFILVIFILWTMFTLMVLMLVKDFYSFFRSSGFILICIVYVIIIASKPILDKMFPEEER